MLNYVKINSRLKTYIFLGIFAVLLAIFGIHSGQKVFLDAQTVGSIDFQKTGIPSALNEYNYEEGSIVIDASATTNTSSTGNWTWAVNTFDWCTGTGVWVDPYVIGGVYFNGGQFNHGLEVLNSRDYYFEIKNCKSNSSTDSWKAGIYLDSTSNGRLYNNSYSLNSVGIYLLEVDNCTLSGNNVSCNHGYGIYLSSSDNNTLLGNNASYNWYGIYLSSSDNNTLLGNNAFYNYFNGIDLHYSYDNTVSGNKMLENGLMISWSFNNDIDTTNLINGKPIYYYEGGIGLNIDELTNVGQLILVNCSDSTISLLNISYVSIGILLSICNNNTISNVNLYNNDYGIYLYSSDNNTLLGNNASYNNNYGIYLSQSNNNMVSANNVYNNWKGILLYDSDYNIVSANNASYNYNGIDLLESDNNYVSGNNVFCNDNFGIHLFFSYNNNTVSDNNVSDNNEFGIYLHSSDDNTLSGNEMFENGLMISWSFNNDIDTTNLINGKPIYYYEGGIGLNIIGITDAGELILVSCSYCLISNSDISYASGILLSDCNNITVMGNNMSYNSNYGIYLDGSDNNTVLGNNASYNDWSGIQLFNSDNNTVSGNTASHNSHYGIHLDYSCNNGFWLNYISDNTILEAYDSGKDNTWDNGTHGNYWGDYTEKYPSATNDGTIWDTPYEIEGSAGVTDRYPLVGNPLVGKPPDPPTITTVGQTINNGSITVHWTASVGADSYNIYVNGTINGTSATTEKLVSFNTNGTYAITVTAFNASGESGLSNEIIIVVKIPLVGNPPDPPTIPGYSAEFLFGFITAAIAVGVLLVKKRRRR